MSDQELRDRFRLDVSQFPTIASLVRERPNGDIVVPIPPPAPSLRPPGDEVPRHNPTEVMPVSLYLIGMLERAYEIIEERTEKLDRAQDRASQWPGLRRGINFLLKHIAWLERKLARVEKRLAKHERTMPVATIYTDAKVFVRGPEIEIRAFGHMFGYRMNRDDMPYPGISTAVGTSLEKRWRSFYATKARRTVSDFDERATTKVGGAIVTVTLYQIEITAFGQIFTRELEAWRSDESGYTTHMWDELGRDIVSFLREKHEAEHAAV